MHSILKLANDLADIAAKDKLLSERVLQVIEAKELDKRGPLLIMRDFERIFSKEQIAQFPVPGSERKAGSNAPYDKYETIEDNAKVKHTFYGDFAVRFVGGESDRMLKLIAAHKKAMKEGGAAPTAETKNWSVIKLDSERLKYAARKNAEKNLAVKAVQLHLQLAAVRELEANGVKVYTQTEEVKDKEGKKVTRLVNTITPIVIQSTTNALNTIPVAISTFLRYNVEKAKATVEKDHDGDMFAALIYSGPTKGPATPEGDKVGTFTVGMFPAVVNEIANLIGDVAGRKEVMKTLANADDDAIMNFGNTCNFFAMYVWPNVRGRWNALNAEQNKATG